MASGFVDGAGELVGLHSDQTYESAVLALCEAPNNSLYGNERVGLIADFDINRLSLLSARRSLTVKCEPVQA
jgi:hypothetical protein